MNIRVFLATLLLSTGVFANTTITYQGQLQQGVGKFSGDIEMSFQLHETAVGADPIGPSISENVSVANGLFQVELDFGNQPFEDGLWLQVNVDGTDLTPRQRIAGVPFAIRANTAETLFSSITYTTATQLTPTSEFQKMRELGTFTKHRADSTIVTTWNSHTRTRFSGILGSCVYQIRIDNAAPEGQGSGTVHGANDAPTPVSATNIFGGLAAGTREVSLWFRGTSGVTNCLENGGGWTRVVQVMEY